MNIRSRILALTLCIAFSSICQAKTIIWDLGGVLFTSNKTTITLHELGIGSILGYIFLDFKNPRKLQRKAFDVLNHFGTQTSPDHVRLKSPCGMELPQLFVDVLTGEITHKEALEKSIDLINTLYERGCIHTRREKKLLIRIMHTMFDSPVFIKHTHAIQAGADLVAFCAQHPHCTQYVLSNWDAHSFSLLYDSEHGQKIFQHIVPENIMISGACKLAKPDPAIFHHLIDTHGLDPQECIFIDDTYENIEAAKALGFNTIYFHNMSYSDLKKILIRSDYLTMPSNGSAKTTNYATV